MRKASKSFCNVLAQGDDVIAIFLCAQLDVLGGGVQLIIDIVFLYYYFYIFKGL